MASKRKMPIKTATLDFAEDGYEGFHCERRTNAPMHLVRAIYTDINEDAPEVETREMLLRLFPSWDFVDEEGKAIPHTVEGFDLLPGDLVMAMHRRGFEALRNGAMPAPLGTDSSDEPSVNEQGLPSQTMK